MFPESTSKFLKHEKKKLLLRGVPFQVQFLYIAAAFDIDFEAASLLLASLPIARNVGFHADYKQLEGSNIAHKYIPKCFSYSPAFPHNEDVAP
mgnify:FL=1